MLFREMTILEVPLIQAKIIFGENLIRAKKAGKPEADKNCYE